jgi:hypothetical protein
MSRTPDSRPVVLAHDTAVVGLGVGNAPAIRGAVDPGGWLQPDTREVRVHGPPGRVEDLSSPLAKAGFWA